MRKLIIGLLLLTLSAFPVNASAACADTTGMLVKIQDKISSGFDRIMPFLLHDPLLTIRFHISRAQELYKLAYSLTQSDPARAVQLSVRGENHLTLLEGSIRQVLNPRDTPFSDIFSVFETISGIQRQLLSGSTQACSPPIAQLQSFESQTDLSIKKLYYESLLR